MTSLHGVRDSLEENINKFYEDVLETITVKSFLLLRVEQLMFEKVRQGIGPTCWPAKGRQVSHSRVESEATHRQQPWIHLGFETHSRYK